MMSLTKVTLAEIVKKQYLFKLKANIDSFSSLVWIQLLAILFSFGGIGSSGMGMGEMNIDVKYYSSDMVIVFSLNMVLCNSHYNYNEAIQKSRFFLYYQSCQQQSIKYSLFNNSKPSWNVDCHLIR